MLCCVWLLCVCQAVVVWFVTLGCGVLLVLLCSLLLHLTLFGVVGVVVVCCVVLVCVVSFCGGFALAWCCCVVFCYCVALLCWVVHSDYCICMHALCLPCDAVCFVLFRDLTVMFVGVVVLCFVLVPRFVLPCICLSCFCVFCSLLFRHLFVRCGPCVLWPFLDCGIRGCILPLSVPRDSPSEKQFADFWAGFLEVSFRNTPTQHSNRLCTPKSVARSVDGTMD